VKRLLLKLSLIIVLVGLPLLGVILAGKPLAQYREFPPVSRYVEHDAFSWPAFFGLALFVCIATAPFVVKILAARPPKEEPCIRQRFPGWGWLGVGLLALAWALAWTRFPWFHAFQGFTFGPIWLGYIIVINALTFRRTGHCLMLDRPRYFLWLFPLSAGFWWYFEYLNRFVQNWHYIGIAAFGPLEYFIYATLPFSTVLPAVLCTTQWLESFPRLTMALWHFWPIRIRHWKSTAVLVFILGAAGLAGLGVWPDVLFPLLWISPLLMMASFQVLVGERSLLSGLRNGDWRSIWLPALAGLVCGLLWELWNSKSLAHWQYAVPYVQKFSLFEMPLLGYAGYLPFGVECVLIADLFLGDRTGNRSSA
jgi:hypothetical protein